jgi:hypothetical protein
VRVLVDGFGARDFEGRPGRRLAAAGVEVLTYRPEAGRFASAAIACGACIASWR